ncbi:SGNH/GDSL hydrolase family protein [Dactylosporangium sp. NPDC051541]|uniref:SGNH/GDSL hydrolase family protein n=1 Tax=Dactylosporangium sp. NPDC051541 TaxID=3363977 RepID=UPI0037BD157F
MTQLDDPFCLALDPARALLAGAPWRRLVVLGDSIAAHPGDPVPGYSRLTWAEQLTAALRPTLYRNLGVVGARAAEVRAAQLPVALAFAPDLAVVAAGANDAFRRSFTPDPVTGDLEHLMGALHRGGALVVTFGCFDVGHTDRLRALNDLTAAIAHRHGGLHLDFGDHPAQATGVFGDDGLHINARGHAVVAAALVRALAARVSRS